MADWTEAMVDFTRGGDGVVQAVVSGPLDLDVWLVSDDPESPRSWQIEEIQLRAGPSTTIAFWPSKHGPVDVDFDCEIGRILAQEWDRYVVQEQRFRP